MMKWTKERCIEELKKAAQHGVVSYKDAAKVDISLPSIARRRFGSFALACKEAGLVAASKSKRRYLRCVVDGCRAKPRSTFSKYCEAHYMRLRRRGTLDIKKPRTQYNHTSGYVLIYAPGHPLLKEKDRNYEYEHRVVFYDKHGEGPFSCHWCGQDVTWNTMHVDHKDAIRDHNDINNLVPSCPLCNQARGHHKTKQTMQDKMGIWIDYEGQRKLLSDWAKEIGISRTSLQARIKKGWGLERALSEPRGKTGPKTREEAKRGRHGYL